MAVPLALNAFLCLLIPLEELLLRTGTVYAFVNMIAEGTVIIELTLLAMGRHGASGIWKRRATGYYARLQPIPVEPVRSDPG